ncbi:MAG: hypothetical protein AB7I30_14800 [Isosphaeraceae bacterium]
MPRYGTATCAAIGFLAISASFASAQQGARVTVRNDSGESVKVYSVSPPLANLEGKNGVDLPRDSDAVFGPIAPGGKLMFSLSDRILFLIPKPGQTDIRFTIGDAKGESPRRPRPPAPAPPPPPPLGVVPEEQGFRNYTIRDVASMLRKSGVDVDDAKIDRGILEVADGDIQLRVSKDAVDLTYFPGEDGTKDAADAWNKTIRDGISASWKPKNGDKGGYCLLYGRLHFKRITDADSLSDYLDRFEDASEIFEEFLEDY